ncbi:MAG: hypothetical protein ACR2NU_17095, partial [Aeoliella sp.]
VRRYSVTARGWAGVVRTPLGPGHQAKQVDAAMVPNMKAALAAKNEMLGMRIILVLADRLVGVRGGDRVP